MNKCRICGNTANHTQIQAQERMFGWEETFSYFECQECGCLQIVMVPTDLHRFYPAEYYSLSKTPELVPGPLRRFLNRQRLYYRVTGKGAFFEKLTWRLADLPYKVIQVLPYLKPIPYIQHWSRFLDLGCGEHSDWLGALAQCGYKRLTGADPYLKSPGKRDGINYLCSTTDDIPGQFDFISMHHSLEHIIDQHATLHHLNRLLAPGGICMIRVPLVDSLVWEQYGVDWVELDAPRHLYLHTKRSMDMLADASGFEIFHILFDSTTFEFAGSAQYRAGIPLTATNSFWGKSDGGIFTQEMMANFHEQAEAANKTGRGGRAAFYLRKSQ